VTGLLAGSDARRPAIAEIAFFCAALRRDVLLGDPSRDTTSVRDRRRFLCRNPFIGRLPIAFVRL